MQPQLTPEYLASQDLSPTIVQRFWKHVHKTESCWLWTAWKQRGYGRMVNYHIIGTKRCTKVFAHHVSWIIHCGPIPDGLWVLHNCPGGDCPACVNPRHLWLGTCTDNNRDKMVKGTAMHKLSDADVDEIKRLRATGMTNTELAGRFGCSQPNISNTLNGHIHKPVARPHYRNPLLA